MDQDVLRLVERVNEVQKFLDITKRQLAELIAERGLDRNVFIEMNLIPPLRELVKLEAMTPEVAKLRAAVTKKAVEAQAVERTARELQNARDRVKLATIKQQRKR